jgi:hypothetical protein
MLRTPQQVLMEAMAREKPWQTKEGALLLLAKLAGSAKFAVQAALPELVPAGSECLVDAREQVCVRGIVA